MRQLLIAISAVALSSGIALAQTSSSAPAGTTSNSVAKSNTDMGQNVRGKGTRHRRPMKTAMMKKSTKHHHAMAHHTKKTASHSVKKTTPKPSANGG